MASGDTLYQWQPSQSLTGVAVADASGMTIESNHRNPIPYFRARADYGRDTYLYFPLVLPAAYGGTTGVTFDIDYMVDIAGSGNVQFGVTGFKATASSTAWNTTFSSLWGTEATATNAVPTTAGQHKRVSIAVAKAVFGSAAAGTLCVFRVRRYASDTTNDTATSTPVHILSIHIKET